MYTYIPGYKFSIVIYPIGVLTCANEAMFAHIYTEQGEYDDQLVWPAKAKFSLWTVH